MPTRPSSQLRRAVALDECQNLPARARSRCRIDPEALLLHNSGTLVVSKPDNTHPFPSHCRPQSVLVHQLSKRASQNPFRKNRGRVVKVAFHPTKPFFFVATQNHVRDRPLGRPAHPAASLSDDASLCCVHFLKKLLFPTAVTCCGKRLRARVCVCGGEVLSAGLCVSVAQQHVPRLRLFRRPISDQCPTNVRSMSDQCPTALLFARRSACTIWPSRLWPRSWWVAAAPPPASRCTPAETTCWWGRRTSASHGACAGGCS